MPLNIKKPNILSTSSMDLLNIKSLNREKLKEKNKDHPFIHFIEHLEKSWEIKKIDISKGESLLYNEVMSDIDFTPDDLKNKSLITYVDSPWGSGKTFFIENFLKWVAENKIKLSFSNSSNEKRKEKFIVIDAWEIYNESNIEDFLIKTLPIDKEGFLKHISSLKKKDLKEVVKNKRRTFFVPWKKIISSITLKVNVPLFASAEFDLSKFFEKNEDLKNEFENIQHKFENIQHEDQMKLMIYSYIEKIFSENDYIMIIDNIERLNSKNRLDIINKIMNWANIKGATYIFLTNFEKIKITKEFEEDFWNKISLYETFKLENDWKKYVTDYSHTIDVDGQTKTFTLKEHSSLMKIIMETIPLFFDKDKDPMDIREVKKILDNWKYKFEHDKKEKELMISFIQEIVRNISGLNKYFFINKIIGVIDDNDEIYKIFEQKLYIDKTDDLNINIPMLNNKMLRIQSNFFELKLIKNNNELVFDEKIDFLKGEKNSFIEFNNFIDDHSFEKFKEAIIELLGSRQIKDTKNKLFDYFKDTKKQKINYFEFKYNNLRKIHIYNLIFYKDNQ